MKRTEERDTNDETQILQDFLLTTTAHGYHKIGLLRGQRLLRYLWTFLLIAFFCGLAYHLSTILKRYLAFPLNTEIGHKEVPYRNPDFTVCARTPFSRIRSNRTLQPPFPANTNLSSTLIAAFQFWDTVVPSAQAEFIAMQSVLPLVKQTNAWHVLNEVLVICQSDSQNCSEAFKIDPWLHPTQGKCWTLTPHQRYPSNAAQAGLKLFVFHEDPFYDPDLARLPPLARTDEVLLLTHPAGEYPDVNGALTLVTTMDRSVTQRIRMTYTVYPKYHSSIQCVPPAEVKPIKVLVGPSRDVREFAYSRDLCQKVKLAQVIIDRCKCVDTSLPLTPTTEATWPSCFDLEQLLTSFRDAGELAAAARSCKDGTQGDAKVCSLVQIARSRISCLKNVHKAYANASLNLGQCLDPCDQQKYEITSSINYLFVRLWNRQLRSIVQRIIATEALEGLQKWYNTPNFKGCCFSQIHVLTESERGDRIEEKESYPLANLLSDVGGTLGLWVGFSVITIFEFIELPLRLAGKKIKQ